MSRARPSGPGATGSGESGWQGIATILLVVLLAWFAGAIVPTLGGALAWVATGVAAAIAGLLCWRRPVTLALALLPVTLITATGLIPDAGRYQPTAVVVVPLGLIWALRLVRGESALAVPERRILAVVGAYIAWCAVTTVTSTARGTSAVYLGGIIATLALIYGASPMLFADAKTRRRVLAVVAAMGVACVLIGLALAFGPQVVFGRPIGQYEIVELTVLGNPVGLVYPRVLGPFLASNGQGINCALALVALVALRAVARGRLRMAITLTAVVVLVALLVTMSRNGWLVAIAGLGAVAAPDFRRLRPTFAVANATIMALAFALILVNAIGADRRPDLMAARYGTSGSDVSGDLSAPSASSPAPESSGSATATPGLTAGAPSSAAPSAGPSASDAVAPSPPAAVESPAPSPGDAAPTRETLRGGSGLTGRLDLWEASATAIRERPVVGWGLGQVIEAIAPNVPPSLAGLTSHSTWVRAAVETGIPGLAVLIAWVLASGTLIVRRLRDPEARTDPIRLAFVGSFLGLTAAATFDSFLLGGVTFMNIYWALSAVLAAAVVAPAVTQRDTEGAKVTPE